MLTTAQRLGFAATDRVVILHADDIGMCHATIPAFEHLLEAGLTSSYAIMTPCAWASAALEIAKASNADVGVHITLTSEWQHYRWKPLSTLSPTSGLFDAEGFMPRGCDELLGQVLPQAARLEMQAQFRVFAEYGVNPSHMDSHMLSSFWAKLLPEYVATALEYSVMALFPNTDIPFAWMDPKTFTLAKELTPKLLARGFAPIDHVNGMPLDTNPNNRDNEFDVRLEQAKALLAELKVGITHFAFHPSIDSPELRAICPDWKARVGDEQVFRSQELRDFLEQQGIMVIGYQPLNDLFNSL